MAEDGEAEAKKSQRKASFDRRVHLISYGAALIYVFNQTLVYSISLYSESLFLFFHLLSVHSLHWTWLSLSSDTAVQTGKMFTFLPIVLVSIFTRSTGGLITIVPIYFVVHKIARNLWGTGVRKELTSLPPGKDQDSSIIYRFFAYILGSLYSGVKGVKYFVILLFL